jgi:hypothetical protein
MLWKLIVDIYEPAGAGTDYPVVQHTFYGRTQREAQGYFVSHMKTDKFMADCVTQQRWERVDCQASMRWERVR